MGSPSIALFDTYAALRVACCEMAPARILVADDDGWISKMVATFLEKRGYQVEAVADGELALERAIEEPPDLLITDVMMPGLDGWTLVKNLRSRPAFAFLPVIFLTALTSDDDRIRGFRLGADDYVPKPFRFEELELRVVKTLRNRTMLERTTREQLDAPEQMLTGDLAHLGLPSLLTLLEMEQKSGLLELNTPPQAGKIWLRNGRIVRAELDSRPEPRNAECIYELLRWSSGRFSFRIEPIDFSPEMDDSTTHLLIEGARRLDESQNIR